MLNKLCPLKKADQVNVSLVNEMSFLTFPMPERQLLVVNYSLRASSCILAYYESLQVDAQLCIRQVKCIYYVISCFKFYAT